MTPWPHLFWSVCPNCRRACHLPRAQNKDGDSHRHLLAIGRSVPKDTPANLSIPTLDRQCSIDFINLIQNQFIVEVSIGMKLSQDTSRLLSSPFCEQPSWRLGHERQHCNQKYRSNTLDLARNSPTPAGVHVSGAEASPSSNDGTNIPKGVEEAQDRASLSGVS